jgi:hypothetical protein
MNNQNCKIRIKFDNWEIEVEGNETFVEKHIEKFKKEIIPIFKEKTAFPDSDKKSKSESLSLEGFYRSKSPKTDKEVAVTIAYYFKHYRNKSEVKPKEIGEEAAKLGHRISNPRAVLRGMTKEKKPWMRQIKRGIFEITNVGEEVVENELPRKSEK